MSDNVRLRLIANIDDQIKNKTIDKNNGELLKKLITNADSSAEAIAIAELGTNCKQNGVTFKITCPQEKSNSAKVFIKNEKLSFVNKKNNLTHKLIIGDNYDALLYLSDTYRKKIDVIYIDPPYSMDSSGQFANTNYHNAFTRDDLLSMLSLRLEIAKQLLTDTGVIFVSIDDKNYAYVKCLMDEIFDEKNFAGTILWQKKNKTSFLSKNFGTIHEYIICYTKDSNHTFPFSLEKTKQGKKYPFNNAGNGISVIKFPPKSILFNLPDGKIKAQDMSEGNIKTKLLNEIEIKDKTNINEVILEGEWRYSQDKINDFVKNNMPITIAQIPFRPNLIKDGNEIKKMKNVLSKTFYNCETNEDGEKQLKSIFNDKVFEKPKPVGLIKLLLKACTYNNKDATVLDFFAGSGTTGEAVMNLNREDGGKRKFILCTLNEITKENLNGIAYDVTSKRLKRIMSGCCYDGNIDFNWIKNNTPYMDNLEVLETQCATSDKTS